MEDPIMTEEQNVNIVELEDVKWTHDQRWKWKKRKGVGWVVVLRPSSYIGRWLAILSEFGGTRNRDLCTKCGSGQKKWGVMFAWTKSSHIAEVYV